MKVRDVMTRAVVSCKSDTTVAVASGLMWKGRCGFLPVIGEGGNVIGVITDRDIGIALGTCRNRRPSEVEVEEIMGSKLFTCTAEDSVHSALTTMRIQGLRRLPVTDPEGTLVGVLSIDDLALRAKEHAFKNDISYKDVEETYKAIDGQAARTAKSGRAA